MHPADVKLARATGTLNVKPAEPRPTTPPPPAPRVSNGGLVEGTPAYRLAGEIEGLVRDYTGCGCCSDEPWDTIEPESERIAVEALAGVQAVLDLHQPIEGGPNDGECSVCAVPCGSGDPVYEDYPCTTVRLLTGQEG